VEEISWRIMLRKGIVELLRDPGPQSDAW
jgi:hypothetical protein